ncbi:unnamed protein product [Schistosoma mattheei]|uniref:Uncharacterized protein n=1 Tax=Schistosoma mattheei TaxID=31246 RepID=A0A183P3Y5_9TREM|nr:unnamed protein product [Schistosoma mattheei]
MEQHDDIKGNPVHIKVVEKSKAEYSDRSFVFYRIKESESSEPKTRFEYDIVQIDSTKPDIIAVTETWLTQSIDIMELGFDGFTLGYSGSQQPRSSSYLLSSTTSSTSTFITPNTHDSSPSITDQINATGTTSTSVTTTTTTTMSNTSTSGKSTYTLGKEIEIELGSGVSEEDTKLAKNDKNAVDFVFDYCKLWCKTCKDLVLTLEKRATAVLQIFIYGLNNLVVAYLIVIVGDVWFQVIGKSIFPRNRTHILLTNANYHGEFIEFLWLQTKSTNNE